MPANADESSTARRMPPLLDQGSTTPRIEGITAPLLENFTLDPISSNPSARQPRPIDAAVSRRASGGERPRFWKGVNHDMWNFQEGGKQFEDICK